MSHAKKAMKARFNIGLTVYTILVQHFESTREKRQVNLRDVVNEVDSLQLATEREVAHRAGNASQNVKKCKILWYKSDGSI